ncbi:MAG: hypothetical protein K6D37_00590 [Prevotella sp.]|nr:hypothetical protein [Prevotella sp.]
METQLVRLDKPYNIICAKGSKFALHIATLIIVKEEPQKNEEPGEAKIVTSAHSYPVVGGSYISDGEVWMESELKECMVVCREGETVGLYELKKVMSFYGIGEKMLHFVRSIPARFSFALLTSGSKLELPIDDNGLTIRDYEVCLEFSKFNKDTQYTVSADNESKFYFYDFVANESIPGVSYDFIESIEFISDLRDMYLQAFRFEGLRSIIFTTKDTSFQWYVDKLNNTKPDGAGV